jgi:hypothetical protein
MIDPLSLAAGLKTRLAWVLAVIAALWALVAWALR